MGIKIVPTHRFNLRTCIRIKMDRGGQDGKMENHNGPGYHCKCLPVATLFTYIFCRDLKIGLLVHFFHNEVKALKEQSIVIA